MVKSRSELRSADCQSPCCYCSITCLPGSRGLLVLKGLQGQEETVGLATSELGQDSRDAIGVPEALRLPLKQALCCTAHRLSRQSSTQQQSKHSCWFCSYLDLSHPNHQTTRFTGSRTRGANLSAVSYCE